MGAHHQNPVAETERQLLGDSECGLNCRNDAHIYLAVHDPIAVAEVLEDKSQKRPLAVRANQPHSMMRFETFPSFHVGGSWVGIDLATRRYSVPKCCL
jgi:hypothetical protein